MTNQHLLQRQNFNQIQQQQQQPQSNTAVPSSDVSFSNNIYN
jgi:hypothetical protein